MEPPAAVPAPGAAPAGRQPADAAADPVNRTTPRPVRPGRAGRLRGGAGPGQRAAAEGGPDEDPEPVAALERDLAPRAEGLSIVSADGLAASPEALSQLLADVLEHMGNDVEQVSRDNMRAEIERFDATSGDPEVLLELLDRIAEAWRPHRTLAGLYLWRSLANTPVVEPPK